MVHHLLDGHGPAVPAGGARGPLSRRAGWWASTARTGFPYRALPRRSRRPAAALAQGHRPPGDAASSSSPTAPGSLVLRQMQPIQHLTLEIIDYPGEWLLDLPLLEESFAQFSRARARAGRAARAPRGRGRLAASRLRGLRPRRRRRTRPPSRRWPRLYRRYLLRLPHELGLSRGAARPLHQSGRPRGLAAAAVLPAAARRDPARQQPCAHGASGSSATARRWCARFYEEHFSRFDRQIVLVDLLGGAQRRPGAFRRHPAGAGA